MNISMFTGNVGNVRSLKTVGSDSVLSFSVAVKNGFKKETPPIWKECSIWGRRAEALSRYIEKGTSVTVTANETEEHWMAKDGAERSKLKFSVVEIALHPKGAASSHAQPSAATQSTETTSSSPGDDIEEDVPF
ncbi:single-stranded DNA-binding protein [Puniceicoccaceae bacterium K14]|nr:single-stranded DNA-binding protein [Puniceicoccaceae bacterium K14]